jgi:RimJ/RimL family protein N-acetyltransferase
LKQDCQIQTERLVLRGWTTSQADRIAFHRLNADETVMKFYPFRRTRRESDELLDTVLQMNRSQGYGWAAVCLQNTGVVIGFSGIVPVNYFDAAFLPADEIGWRLLPEHWHKGYATEAATALLNHAFETLNRQRIVAFAVPANQASINVMRRIGMKAEPRFDFDHPNVPDTHPHLRRHVFYVADSI